MLGSNWSKAKSETNKNQNLLTKNHHVKNHKKKEQTSGKSENKPWQVVQNPTGQILNTF